jgi:hypothetical protein
MLLPDGTCPRCEPVWCRTLDQQAKVTADLETLKAEIDKALHDPSIPFGQEIDPLDHAAIVSMDETTADGPTTATDSATEQIGHDDPEHESGESDGAPLGERKIRQGRRVRPSG